MDVIKLLIIDDDDADKMHFRRALRTCGFNYELVEQDNADQANSDFLSTFDCIFLDYLLPSSNGLSLLKKIRDCGIKTPIVIITSQGNESIAVELMKAGASDYVVKNNINGQLLGQVLRNMLYISSMIKEKEQAERALRESESRLAEAQRIAKTGNWELNVAQNTLYCSAEIYNILEIPQDEVVLTKEKAFDLINRNDWDMIHASLQKALEGKPFSIDFSIVTRYGLKYTHSQGYAVKGADGAFERIVGTLQDITERKLAEQEISNARKEAETSMKVREVFLANMSHEIRTPMNAILGFTRLLYETNPTLEQKEFIDAIHFSGENLLVIINDILDLSKLQSGKMSIEKCEFNLHELIAGIVAVMRQKAQEKGIRLLSHIANVVPQMIKGDPVRLNQILTNLLSNAIKFTEKGTVKLEVTGAASENQDILIEFKIADSGIGIPVEKQAVIFEAFTQASSDTTRKYGGTGLGLAIVKNLVELQAGTISVSSQPDSGSTFTVHLPFEQVNTGTQAPSSFSTAQALPHELTGISVLVAEDNPVNQLLVKRILEKAGCKIDIASNGMDAITRISTKRYDMVLMDVQMPEMDGYEATTHIRNKLSQPACHVPIIAMTAHAFGTDAIKCISAGMNDYISKPFQPEDLYAKIAKHLNNNSYWQEVKKHPENILKQNIDLSSMYMLENGSFLNELVSVYSKQTPELIEKLENHLWSHDFEGMRTVCQRIRSFYGVLKLNAMDNVLQEIGVLLNAEDPDVEYVRITALVNNIILLISAINEEVKRNLGQTGCAVVR